MTFLKIHDTKRLGDYLVVHARDFVEGVHRLFDEPLADPATVDENAPPTRCNALHDDKPAVSAPSTPEEVDAFLQDIGRPEGEDAAALDTPQPEKRKRGRPRKATA